MRRQQEPVLIPIVETPDEQQGLIGRRDGGPSFDRQVDVVWLQPLDECPVPGEYRVQQVGFHLPVLLLIRVLDKGKLDGEVGSPAKLGELPDDVIQRRAQVVDNVSGDQRQMVGRPRPRPIEVKSVDVIAGLRINLGDEFVGFAVREGTDFAVESIEVLPGARNFQARTVQRMSHCQGLIR